jgi:choline dehydrogenase-like flavoprotein
MKREDMLLRIKSRTKPLDIVVIGGGAVGAGVALDASARGLETLLIEREDSDTPCVTADLRIHGYHPNPKELGALGVYGRDAEGIRGIVRENAAFGETLRPKLPYIAAEVVWSGASRDVPNSRRCAGAPHPGAAPECPCGHGHRS